MVNSEREEIQKAAIQQAAREWLRKRGFRERLDGSLQNHIGETFHQGDELVAAMADFHISQSEEERKRIQELEEWKKSVSSAIKTIPEFHSGQWGGDKEGWGFHFEVVNWLRRTKETSEAEVSRLRGALEGLLAVADTCQDMMPDEIVRFDAAVAVAEAALSPASPQPTGKEED